MAPQRAAMQRLTFKLFYKRNLNLLSIFWSGDAAQKSNLFILYCVFYLFFCVLHPYVPMKCKALLRRPGRSWPSGCVFLMLQTHKSR